MPKAVETGVNELVASETRHCYFDVSTDSVLDSTMKREDDRGNEPRSICISRTPGGAREEEREGQVEEGSCWPLGQK